MRIWVGVIMAIGGVALGISSRLERDHVPATFPRLAAGIFALGLSTLATTRPGIAWSWVSIVLSIIAIFCLISVIRQSFRR
ncbi:MAG: hypothetical protein ACR2OG_16720 [Gemmatimonadaceae bacterium]